MPNATTMPRRQLGARGTHLDEKWFTVEQIAEAIQVTDQTVRRWLRDGTLRGTPFGGKAGWRVRESDFNAFLAAREPQTEQP